MLFRSKYKYLQDDRLLLPRFFLPPGLEVFVLAEVHDAADRRLCLRRHLDEIELLLLRGLERLLDRQDAELRPLGADDADLPNADGFVDANFLCFADRRGSSFSRGTRRE